MKTWNIVILLLFSNLYADIYINEIMSANGSTIYDEFGESSDWIELYNGGSSTVNIGGYGLTDNPDELYKWVFPSTSIAPDSHVLVFASGTEIESNVQHWETIINWGDTWKYFLGNFEPPSTWNQIEFNDSDWLEGESGFGYGDGDDATIVPNIISVFVRKTFYVDSIEGISEAILHVDYDDAFVAYLNGIEIARNNIGNSEDGPPPYNQGADEWHEAVIFTGGFPEMFEIDLNNIPIQNGENVLSIQVHNYNANSSDMSLIPFLTLGLNYIPENSSGVPDILNLNASNLHANFKISSSGEDILLTDLSGDIVDQLDSLVIPTDISFGRKPDGGDDWFFFADPTPSESNNNSTGFESSCEAPQFLSSPGFYNGSIQVEVESNQDGYPIYYTIDGSIPTTNSNIYSGPININETSVIRASILHPSCISSKVSTASYFINEEMNLPIVSLATEPDNLWDWETGIYVMGPNASTEYPYLGANFWEDWEKPIHVEFFELDGSLGFAQNAGVKIFGGWSRGQEQKSLALYARPEYGEDKISYQIFPDKDLNEFSAIVLRNSGNDWYSGNNWSSNAMFRDGMMTGLMQGTGIDYQEYRPAIVYINGEYWGIHNIREKVNEEFLASNNPGVDPDELDQLEVNGNIIEGDNQDYLDMINFIENNPLYFPNNYEYIKNQMDIDNFIDYYIAQIYYANTDWPGNNSKLWRPHTPGGKWKWILYDTDFGFGLVQWAGHNTLVFALEPNGPGWPNPPWSTFLFRSLMENEEFQIKFINHFCYYLNTRFENTNVVEHISNVSNHISPEMSNHIFKWGGSFVEWSQNAFSISNFGDVRDEYVFSHLEDYFDLDGNSLLTVSALPPGAGTISTSGQPIPTNNWLAKYFNGIPIELTATANPGYTFSYWSGADNSIYPSTTITLDGNSSITAVFVENDSPTTLVINEFLAANQSINTDEYGDYEDWLEIYYDISGTMNLGGYFLTDDLDEPDKWMFPNMEISGEGHLLVWLDDDDEEGPLHTNFKLSASGESLALFDSNLNLIDSIDFGEQTDNISYGRSPDGSNNWQFFENPTPGDFNEEINPCELGDINCDYDVNILDVVQLVAFILGNADLTGSQQDLGDINFDGNIDILDVVSMLSIILDY